MNSPKVEAVEAATRAIAHDGNLRLRIGGRAADEEIAIPAADVEDPKEWLMLRGEADHAALMRRYHDDALHSELRFSGHAGELFDALEEARVDWLGGAVMRGVRANTARRAENVYVPTLREITEKVPKEFEALSAFAGDQRAYAKAVEQLLNELGLLDEEPGASRRRPSENFAPEENTGAEAESPEMSPNERGGSSEESEGKAVMTHAHAGADIPAPPAGAEPQEMPRPGLPATDAKDTAVMHYRAYTQKFDEVIAAEKLISREELEQLSTQLENRMPALRAAANRLSARLQRLLLAKQAREWHFDQEEGLLDTRRLARVVAAPTSGLFYKKPRDTEFKDTVVTLLIDNSGSMRGRPITIAALSAGVLAGVLERCGVKVEILGFTTKEWKGGAAYKQWVKAGRPANPGRLNDLRHIIYKSADVPWRKARKNLGLMLKDGILKENIDGEAILWAAARLMDQPSARRILMVISDGAPVDDSTLSANSGNYLDLHLHEAIATIEQQGMIELLAIGIGHDVTRYYKRAVTLSDIDRLPETMTTELTALFTQKKA